MRCTSISCKDWTFPETPLPTSNIDEAPGLFIISADNASLNGDYTLTGGGEPIAASARY